MRVQKKVLFLSVFFMIVGFAAVSTTLYLNGTIGIGTNEPDFDVYFSKAVEDGVENNSLIQDKTHLTFRAELSKINEKYVLEYDVTNASKQYDASISINCTGGNEYLRVENKFNTTEDLKAREIRSGRLTLTVIKSVFEETEVNISCEITGRAVERIEAGGESIDKEQVDYLRTTGYSSTTYLGHTLDKSKVESITLKDTKNVPEGVESWDVSSSENGSILAYTLDEDNDDMLELYIGQNGGVNANSDSMYLFDGFTNVTNINGLEYLDTSKVTDMTAMFSNCSKLAKLDVSSLETEKVTRMNSMFNGCSSLTSLDVSGFDTSKVLSMSSMFHSCSSLTTLDLNHFDTGNVTNMEMMFQFCNSLVTLDLSHFDTSKVTNMFQMFLSCSNLIYLDMSHFDTSNVEKMAGMFSGCKKIVSLNISHFNTSNVTSMRELFSGCNSLMTLDLSKFDTSNVTNMYGMFYSCNKLTTLNLNGFKTNNVTSMENMFQECSSLTNLDVSNFNTSSVTSMKSMFSGCEKLEFLDLSHFDTNKVTNMWYMFSNCNKLTTTITIKGTNCTIYDSIFVHSATSDGSQITVNYTEDASDLVDKMIATKSSNSNVIKGTVVQ